MATNRRFVIVSDSHGDMIDRVAANAALKWIRKYKPDQTIHAGDYADVRPFRTGASDADKAQGAKLDVADAVKFLKELRPTHVLEGNHDFRLHRAARDGSGLVKEYAGELLKSLSEVFDDLGVKWTAWGKRHGVLKLGNDWRVIHGYHAGLYAGRQAASVYGNVVMGHVHRVEDLSWPHVEGPKRGVICGCLCALDFEYNLGHANTLAQQHGFVYGEITPQGRVIVRTARIDAGEVSD